MTTLRMTMGDTKLGLSSKGRGAAMLASGVFFVLMLLIHPASAQQTGGLELPEDIAARSALGDSTEKTGLDGAVSDATSLDDNRKYYIEERRIEGRLERVTVRRKNGFDEIYENPEVDSMWVTEDKELGELQNVRRWTIGSW